MAKGDDIQIRLVDFAVGILEFCESLPKTQSARHMAEQLMRSATAGAPNYAEARTGESLRDFVHKLGIVRKELNESLVWLQILDQAGLGDKENIAVLRRECDELCRIICASKKTAATRSNHERATRNKF